MRKILLLSAVSLLMLAVGARADGVQTLTVNGETVEKTVVRITFDGDNVVLHFDDDSQQTADMNTVVLGFSYSGTVAVGTLHKPVGNVLHLEGLDEGIVVSIYDAQGKIVATATASLAKATLAASSLKSGVYLLKAGNQAVKFIKR